MAAYGSLSSLLLSLDSFYRRWWSIFLMDRPLRTLREIVVTLRCSLEKSSTVRDTHQVFGESLESKIRDVAFRAEDLVAHALTQQTDDIEWLEFLVKVFCFVSVCFALSLSFQFSPTRILFYGPVFYFVYFSAVFFAILLALLLYVCLAREITLYLRNVIEKHSWRKIIEEMKCVKEEVTKIGAEANDLQSVPSSSRVHFGGISKNAVVGLDSDLNEIKGKLGYGWVDLKVVSIAGMGGIGKTTLAKQVYEDSYIRCHFDICAWVTVSQQYSLYQVVLDILDSARIMTSQVLKETGGTDRDKILILLKEYLYKCLKGRRYLIVIDDVWETEIWDKLRRSFPDDKNGSRVLLTSRLSEVASYPDSCIHLHQMRFLNEHDSWTLLCTNVFGDNDCPRELEDIGKGITRICEGLPLAIAVTSGLLSKGSKAKEYWISVMDNLSSVVLKDDKQCMDILFLSYKHLPHHLRSCFLYMGMFPEDDVVPVAKLIRLWAAEGFLLTDRSKSWEEVGDEYLVDLAERNLILVCSTSSAGKIKTCKIHDILRNLCLLQARRENFLHVIRHEEDLLDEAGKSCRRLSIHPRALVLYSNMTKHKEKPCNPRIHSLLFFDTKVIIDFNYLYYPLLRVLDLLTIFFSIFPTEILSLQSLRFLALTLAESLPSSIIKLRNLQTIALQSSMSLSLPNELWLMVRLRHVHVSGMWLPCPVVDNGFVLQRLQTLADVENFIFSNEAIVPQRLQTLADVENLIFSDEVLDRLRHLKKLGVIYDERLRGFYGWSAHKLGNLVHLEKLEKLKLVANDTLIGFFWSNQLAFPVSLRNLTLRGCAIPWENMTIVGALPNLEVLRLRDDACRGATWQPVEGEFCRLKSLLLQNLDLVQWEADNTHFPCLQRLIIRGCDELVQISYDIGDIATLEMIELVDCLPSVVASVEDIQKDQYEMGNVNLKVHIYFTVKDKFCC